MEKGGRFFTQDETTNIVTRTRHPSSCRDPTYTYSLSEAAQAAGAKQPKNCTECQGDTLVGRHWVVNASVFLCFRGEDLMETWTALVPRELIECQRLTPYLRRLKAQQQRHGLASCWEHTRTSTQTHRHTHAHTRARARFNMYLQAHLLDCSVHPVRPLGMLCNSCMPLHPIFTNPASKHMSMRKPQAAASMQQMCLTAAGSNQKVVARTFACLQHQEGYLRKWAGRAWIASAR